MKKNTSLTMMCLLMASIPGLAQNNITYNLTRAGQVSVNIYDTNGNIVRNFIKAQQRTAGAHTETWDGKDDFGNVLPSGNYTWKLLQTQGLKAKYLMKFGTSLPDSHYSDDDLNFGMGQAGPSGVLVQADSIYITSQYMENVRGALKMPLDGSSCTWGQGNPNGFGRWADVAYLDGYCYYTVESHVTGNGENGILAKLPATQAWPGGSNIPGWNIYYPGDSTIQYYNTVYIDLCAYNSGNNPQLLISYKTHGKVRWLSPNNGSVLDEASVSNVGNLAIENNGNILAVSGNKIVRFSKGNKTPIDVITSNLVSPGHLTVDRSNGDILVADGGASQQVKRFSSSGQLKATYGKGGGRGYGGQYDPKNFQDIVDISYDGHGGFVVAEQNVPMRIGRFDANGNLIKEWYGSSNGIAFDFFVDPDDPTVAWYSGIYETQYVRAILDFNTKTWRVHSVYNLPDLGGGIGRLYTTGQYGALEIRKYNGATYLCSRMQGKGWILRLDENTWTLKAVSVISGSMQWTDTNGDGQVQNNEITNYSSDYEGADAGDGRNFYIGPDLSWYLSAGLYDKTNGAVMKKVPVANWNNGIPVYASPAQVINFGTYPGDIRDRKQHALRVNGGYIYEALEHDWTQGRDLSGWGNTGPARILKWDMSGTLIWDLKPPHSLLDIYNQRGCKLQPGEVGCFGDGTCNDVVNGCVVVPGKDGVWNGNCAGIVHCWDKDGLWVDNLLSKGDLSAVSNFPVPLQMYEMGSEPWSLAVRQKDADVVYLYGSWENHIRIWEISGWAGWTHCSGKVGDSNPGACTTDPATGMDGEKILNDRFSVYPNPANEQTIVSYDLKQNGRVNISVSDLLGKEIMQAADLDQTEGEHRLVIRTAELQNGIYFIKLRCADEQATKKLIISQ